MTEADFILAPKLVTVDFDLAPTVNIVDSMMNLIRVDETSGLAEWAVQTAKALPPEHLHAHKLVFENFAHILYYKSLEEHKYRWPDFPAFIDYLAGQDPYELRDLLVSKLCAKGEPEKDLERPTPEQLIADPNVFINWLTTLWPDHEHDVASLTEVHGYYTNPPAMLDLIVSHLRLMWDKYVRAEWERVLPMLTDSLAAFRKLDFNTATVQEAIRTVTGRDVPGTWESKIQEIERITFIPSAHIGPYMVILPSEDGHYRLIFGARLPKGVSATSSALSRSELLIRLNALADDTRLRILELLVQESELCAQDFITRLDLSQSSVSRHLSQLAATGYVSERRRDVAKCYMLNTERIEDTLNALAAFLLKQ